VDNNGHFASTEKGKFFCDFVRTTFKDGSLSKINPKSTFRNSPLVKFRVKDLTLLS